MRKIALALALCLLAGTASAQRTSSSSYSVNSRTIVGGGSTAAPAANTNKLYSMWGVNTGNAADQGYNVNILPAGTLKSLQLRVSTASGVTNGFVGTLVVNGSDSALTCTITSSSGTSCTATIDAAVTAGQTVSMKFATLSGTTGAGNIGWTIEFDPS